MRKTIPSETQEAVLVLSRRQCCLCYGLNRDLAIKAGQIAHLDRRNGNSDLDNLAYLCLEHHDAYDSRTSQSKSFTPQEARRYRKELHEVIDSAWKQAVAVGDALVRAPGDVTGHYVNDGEFSSAELQVTGLSDGRVRISGIALWGKTREYGPNIGEVEFEAEVRDGKAAFSERVPRGEEYRLELQFQGHRLVAIEQYVMGYFGMNASFEGEYRRID